MSALFADPCSHPQILTTNPDFKHPSLVPEVQQGSRCHGGFLHLCFSNPNHKPWSSTLTCSLEVGGLVAASIARTLDEIPTSKSSSGDDTGPPPPPLQLSTARVVGATLPGRLHFTFAGCGQAMAKPSLEPPPGGRCLATHSERAFYHINLTATGLVSLRLNLHNLVMFQEWVLWIERIFIDPLKYSFHTFYVRSEGGS